MNLKSKIDLRAAILRCKKAFVQEVNDGKIIVNMGDMSLPPPPSTPITPEEAPQILTLSEKQYDKTIETYDEQLSKENLDITDFLTTLKQKLDDFKDITDEFIDSIKTLEDPEVDQDVNTFCNKCVLLRIFFDNSFNLSIDETMKKEDVITMMSSIDFDQEYINLLQKFYFSEGSTRDIIQTFL